MNQTSSTLTVSFQLKMFQLNNTNIDFLLIFFFFLMIRRPPRPPLSPSPPLSRSPGGPGATADQDVRAGDLARLPGELHGLRVDPLDLVLEEVPRELLPVRPERVRLDQLC